MVSFLEDLKLNEIASFSIVEVDGDINRKLNTLDHSEVKRYISIKNIKKKNEWLAGRYAAKKALYSHIGRNNGIVNNKKSGMPYFKNYIDQKLSISHSGNYAAAIVSGRAIGIDIEKVEKRPLSICNYFFSEAEKEAINNCSYGKKDLLLNRYWTRKEAVSKLLGKGGTLPFNKISVIDDDFKNSVFTDKSIKLFTGVFNGYMISLAMESYNG